MTMNSLFIKMLFAEHLNVRGFRRSSFLFEKDTTTYLSSEEIF